MKEFFAKNLNDTKKLAKDVAEKIRKTKKNKSAIIIALQGDLGAGKTTFVQFFAKTVGIKNKLTSPTFVLMKKYKNLYHIDCYRIRDAKDILALDFKEIISIPQNIVLIEWAEKIKKILPKNAIWLKFKIINEKQRKILWQD
jgi:tRNA threonylcarbamoyladenosine biosynthesis protein TsaE